jgi:hypothetical protein
MNVVKQPTPYPNEFATGRADLLLAQAPAPIDTGIEVREEECTEITAQRLCKLRCQCGRSWFELELPRFAQCPACHKVGLVVGT